MSVIRVDNFGPSAGGTTYSAGGIAKAWVNLNGTGTIAIRDSMNVSSLSDLATGYYDVNYSNVMDNGFYSTTTACVQESPYAIVSVYVMDDHVDHVRLNTAQPGTADYDTSTVLAQVMGDLA